MRPLEAFAVYRNPRMLAILAMGFASGLPLALTGGTLSIWLTESQVSLTDVGLFALVGIFYTVKFLWSPVLDRAALPFLSERLGQRRAWLVALSALLAGAIVALGSTDPQADPWRTALFAVAVAFLSASLDVVIDAYRIELLRDDEQAAGSAATQLGYRIAMFASGAGALALATWWGWYWTYVAMAALVAVGVVAALASPEPVHPPRLGSFFRGAVVEPFREFASRPNWLVILVFIVLYRLGDAMVGTMSNPFYVKLGFTKLEIAGAVKTFGIVATMLGIVAGGAFAYRLGLMRALVVAGLIHALSNFAFVAQAYAGPNLHVLFLTIFVENFTGGLVSAATVGYLSTLCNPAFTATQYALLSSISAVPRTIFAAGTGWLAEQLGWPLFFSVGALAALPGIALAVVLAEASGVQFFRRSSATVPKRASGA